MRETPDSLKYQLTDISKGLLTEARCGKNFKDWTIRSKNYLGINQKFCSTKVSLEENYRKAFECLTYLNSLTKPIEYLTPPVIGRKREGDKTLPKYILEVKDKSKIVIGYCVNVRTKDSKLYKSFVGQGLTLEENKKLAIEFLNDNVIYA